MRELTTIGEFLARRLRRPKATWTADMRADRSMKQHSSLTQCLGKFQLI